MHSSNCWWYTTPDLQGHKNLPKKGVLQKRFKWSPEGTSDSQIRVPFRLKHAHWRDFEVRTSAHYFNLCLHNWVKRAWQGLLCKPEQNSYLPFQNHLLTQGHNAAHCLWTSFLCTLLDWNQKQFKTGNQKKPNSWHTLLGSDFGLDWRLSPPPPFQLTG